MRQVNYIVLHCTATPKNTTVQSIQNHWRNVLGWKSPGYHYLYTANGIEVQLQTIDKPTNGVKGHNDNSIHLSYIGGATTDDRTKAQKEAMKSRVIQLLKQFPDAEVLGHCDFPGVVKSCPNFNVKKWLKDEGIHN
jgi:N-acetylmuramoyl-L-alanine amidase